MEKTRRPQIRGGSVGGGPFINTDTGQNLAHLLLERASWAEVDIFVR